MKRFASLALLLALGACGNTNLLTTPPPPPDYSSIVGMIKTNYTTLRAAAEAYKASPGAQAATVAVIDKAEADADPLVATLSATSSPSTIQAVLADLATLAATPVPGISAQTKADINLGLSILNSVVSMAPLILPLL